jgi:5-methylcytosine-specific restriction enzyme B
VPEYSKECLAVLRLLRERHNVLISGAPGTGKSRLLQEVAAAFTHKLTGPVHDPKGKVPVPKIPPADAQVLEVWPSSDRTDRKVFKTVFHQNSKYREFISGIVPKVGETEQRFEVTQGTLYRASEHAKTNTSASLLIIDEINRGPAVQIFGGSIVAIESDKRLNPDGSVGPYAQAFELLTPNGTIAEYALPHHLYLLAAMNQADTSVEPLDVAFLRRWSPFPLWPSADVLQKYFGVDLAAATPDVPATPKDVYAASVKAWLAINKRIALGRGAEYQIGHGVLMDFDPSKIQQVDRASAAVGTAWRVIRAHVDEVFFGDMRGIATVLNIAEQQNQHLYKLEEKLFGDEPRVSIEGPAVIEPSDVFKLLKAVAE